MATRGSAGEGYFRARAAWNQLVADFERRQAEALRDGRLLAIPWRRLPSDRVAQVKGTASLDDDRVLEA